MFILVRLLLSICIVIFVALPTAAKDLENLASGQISEVECTNAVSKATMVKGEMVAHAMKRSYWSCARALATRLQSEGGDVRAWFDLESRLIQKEISGIRAAMESAMPVNIIAPAFQWAQSANEIFIGVKFAHKLDTPATV